MDCESAANLSLLGSSFLRTVYVLEGTCRAFCEVSDRYIHIPHDQGSSTFIFTNQTRKETAGI